jgi:hypothetical protein
MYTRTYSGASARDILTNQQPLDARIAFDRFTADSGKKMKRQADIIDPANARDTSERLNWRVSQAISAASTRDERKEIQLDDALANMGLSTYDRQRLRQDILQGRTRRDMVGEPLGNNSLLPGSSLAEDARIRPTLTPEYSSIYDALRERAGNRIPEPTSDADRKARAATIERELGTDMDWLRGQLIRSGVEGGQRGANGPRGEKKPVTEFYKPQGRFKHLFKPENQPIIDDIQKDVDHVSCPSSAAYSNSKQCYSGLFSNVPYPINSLEKRYS